MTLHRTAQMRLLIEVGPAGGHADDLGEKVARLVADLRRDLRLYGLRLSGRLEFLGPGEPVPGGDKQEAVPSYCRRPG